MPSAQQPIAPSESKKKVIRRVEGRDFTLTYDGQFGRIMHDMDRATQRRILHIDMDAFFAAVEQLDHPEWRGRPLLVGGDPKGRAVVSTASYEARPFGCHSAMPMAAAIRLCPQAIIVTPRMERYAEISHQVFEILEQFTPLVEPISIDEAFLDVTGCERLLGPAEHIARMLKERVRSEVQLTASVGVTPNKFLAKLASDLQKPDGLVIVNETDIASFLAPLPISRLWGVGKATLPEFERLGVHTFGDALGLSIDTLRQHFGETGERFFQLVRGIDDRPVLPDREAKSISHEVTFPVDIAAGEYLRSVILEQIEQVTRRLRRHGLVARTVMLKIRYGDFSTITRRETLPAATDQTDALWNVAAMLFEEWQRTRPRPVRLIGVGVSQLGLTKDSQLSLFESTEASTHHQLDTTMDAIRDRFGERAIGRAGAGHDRSDERELM